MNTSPARAGQAAEDYGRQVKDSTWFAWLIKVGLVSYGIVHLLLAWIALQIAFTGGGGQASQQGAMAKLAGSPVGVVLLWVIAIGLVAIGIWQIFMTIWGYSDADHGTRIRRRIGSGARAVLYLVLAYTAASTAIGSNSSGSAKEESLTAKVLSVPFGRIVVAAVGLGIIAVAGFMIYRGAAKKFTRDLEGSVNPAVIRLGQAGYLAKGIALVIVGILFVVAAITVDPDKAGGLDDALRTLRGEPFGVVLLIIVALGIACYGLYCFAWARHPKRS